MSGYQTEDRLARIEQRLNGESGEFRSMMYGGELFDLIFSEDDVRWLASEVRRYRDEENPNQAAKYWRTIVTQRQMIANQAATIEALTEQVTR